MSGFGKISVFMFCAALVVALARPGDTRTVTDVDVKCPLCHTSFTTKSDVSGTRLGMRLDLKPVGPIAAPWSVPKCPKCHFIVYTRDLSDSEKKALLKLVNSAEYRNLSEDNSTYFLLAKIYETVGMDNLEIAHTYLKASWQVENDGKKYPKYLEAAHAKFAAYLASNNDMSTRHIMAELVSGEIERRLGRFDQARSRFSRIQKIPDFARQGHIAKIIGYQLELIAANDSGPHEIKR
jgi:uncharacterized protein (DUF2225 family)